MTALTDQLAAGLNSPICLTWEWTYACDLQCVHCLSSSGRRDPDELSTDEMKSMALSAGTRLLEANRLKADKEVADALEIALGELPAGSLQHILHGLPVRLGLPALPGRAVVLNADCNAFQGKSVVSMS